MEISIEANPTVINNNIFDGKSKGVYVYNNVLGTIEGNDIYGNTASGVAITEEADPLVKGNQIHENQLNGIRVYEKGKGTFENNELWENAKGSWAIDKGCQVKKSGNRADDVIPKLIRTTPANGEEIESYSSLMITFDEAPASVTVRGETANLKGKVAKWNVGRLYFKETYLEIEWTNSYGKKASKTITLRRPSLWKRARKVFE